MGRERKQRKILFFVKGWLLFSTRPLIDAIQEHLDALTKKYEGCEKPMDSECYWLLRDIAKHILQQHKS